MPFTLVLPNSFAYVLAAASSTFFVNYLHVALVVKHRAASGVKYPETYATPEQAAKNRAAYIFNCAQRAHANFIENQPSFLGALLIAGLRNPFYASVLGFVWVAGRILYALGYSSDKGPDGRKTGAHLSLLGDFSLRCMALYASVMWIVEQS